MNRIVYFDMDGVLADFVSGACRAHGKSLEPRAVEWNFMTQIGFAADDMAFWKPLENPAFWADLEPLADGMDLFRKVEAAVGKDRIAILSSGLCPGSCDGKRTWLDKHLPGYGKSAVFCTRKHLVAAPCKVLLDDHEPNARDFAEASGRSILIPRPWNSRRDRTCLAGRFDVSGVLAELAPLIHVCKLQPDFGQVR